MSAIRIAALASIAVGGACSSGAARSAADVAADSAARDRMLWAAESLRVAETAPGGQSSASRDSTTIAALEQRIENAVVAREIAFLDSAYTSDFQFKHSTGDLDTRAEWIASVRRNRFASRQVDSLDVEVHGDVALTTGRLHVRRSPDDPGWTKDPRWREYTVRYARVYVRRAGRWQLLTHHSTGESF